MSKLKVAVNTRLLLAHRMEGIARYIYETTKRMVKAHPEVEFHFLFDRPYDQKFIFADNVVPHVIGPQSRHPVLWHLWFERSLPRFFKKNKMDLFYSGDMYLSLKTNVPTLYVSHDLNYLHYPEGLKWSHLKFYQKYMPKYHFAADKIVSVSQATKDDIVKQYGIDASKIVVACNALPEGVSKLENKRIEKIKNEITGGEEFFCYVGSLHPRKNIERLIDAFEIFKSKSQSNYKLAIYGRVAWKASTIFEKYNNSKYKDDIIFPDVKKYSAAEILNASFALCYISLFEGFGIPILEAFACETPVITSNISSMPEVAEDAAIQVDPTNTGNIAEGMMRLINENRLRDQLIEKGKERLKYYSWETTAERTFEAILEVANA